MKPLINLSGRRAREARLSARIGKSGFRYLLALGSGLAIASLVLSILVSVRYGLILGSLALACALICIWWKRYLSVLPPSSNDPTGRLSVDVLSRLKPGIALNPSTIWPAIADHWQSIFFLNHLLISKDLVAANLSDDPELLNQALLIATKFSDDHQIKTIELGFVVAGLMITSPGLKQLLIQHKGQDGDIEAVANWLGRNLDDRLFTKQKFGGIGRDWAFGFTPLLDRFGFNISLSITKHGSNFDWLSDSSNVKTIETAFNNHTAAVALIGPEGIGKSTSVYALAQRLIEGRASAGRLSYHQIIGLSATDISSRAHSSGDLERIMLNLSNEAAHAGHVILFLDDAQLFFNDSNGSFDGTQILQSIIQAQAVPIILAMNPSDYQWLKTHNQNLAGLLTPIIMKELGEADVMRVLEDMAIGLEVRNNVMIAYEALREAYNLSGRYEQDEAYPGKAIKLLSQAVSHAHNTIVTSSSVQESIEQSRGLQVGSAKPVEAAALLTLEDTIHERMINQSQAVKAVANALRRARSGVTNPRRPLGSFLFLGPTGVGKTELAKAIAASYFGSEKALLRLDMSEYQNPDDVKRLLSTGSSDEASLLIKVRQQPFCVVLLDELEKAHPNILNLLLQMLDEGQLTDTAGRSASFKDCVIIATSNAGAQTIRERIGNGENLDSFAHELSEQLISSGQFKPELLNRFDEMVLFRPLNDDELAQVVRLMLAEVNATLSNQNISVSLSDSAVLRIVTEASDPMLGARPMRRALQRAVENLVAERILKGQAKPGDTIALDANDLVFD